VIIAKQEKFTARADQRQAYRASLWRFQQKILWENREDG